MKYFIDTEFIEGFRKAPFYKRSGKKTHFIDLISIGIVCEDGREYYAISKEFNYKDADEWVKKNVILPIVQESVTKYNQQAKRLNMGFRDKPRHLDASAITVVQKFEGKTNIQIANDIVRFIYGPTDNLDGLSELEEAQRYEMRDTTKHPEFWAYYADYDWVVFCSLFGRMIDLPKGFPMYCRDIKQLMDETGLGVEWKRSHCPDPKGEHNALVDARWNYSLYKEIMFEQKIHKESLKQKLNDYAKIMMQEKKVIRDVIEDIEFIRDRFTGEVITKH